MSAESDVKRVLFVDDEQLVLEAIERSLFEYEDDGPWAFEFEFESDPRVAMKRLAHETFDVIVSDMRMPGVDGASLLAEARRLQPRVLRIALSGESNREMALRSIEVTHQFLAKPCKPGALISLIQRGLELDASLHSESVKALTRSVSNLPTRPRVYDELVGVLEQETSTIHDVACVVESEPALCARVLHIVNSAFFGLPRSVGSIRDAVNFLGTQTLQSIVLCTEVFRPSSRKLDIDIEAERIRALTVGAIARELGGDMAFTAGVLHRVGHLVLALARQGDAAELAESADPEHVGAYLLGSWGLAHELVEAVAVHRLPVLAPAEAPVTAALHVAVGLVEEMEAREREDDDPESEPGRPLPRPDFLAHFDPELIAKCRARLDRKGEAAA